MKKNLLLIIMLVIIGQSAYSTNDTIRNAGTTFSPATLTIHVGDVVVFILASAHDAVEVTKATYDANGNTSNGGFSVPFGGGSVTFSATGTYYFVCQPHASLGMKGIITVTGASGIENLTSVISDIRIYPNPVSDYLKVSYSLDSKVMVTIRLVNAIGSTVAELLSETRDDGVQEDTYLLKQIVRPGLYFVNIQYGSHSYSKKVIIQ